MVIIIIICHDKNSDNMNNQVLIDNGTIASLWNFVTRYNNNVNNNNFNYQGLFWNKPQDRIKMTLDSCVADELHTLLLMGHTVTLRNLFHQMEVEMGADINEGAIDESLCRLSNEFGFTRNRFPVTTHCARSIRISNANVTLRFNHVDNGWTNFPLTFPAQTLLPQDYEMRLWTEVDTTADFQMLVEADGIADKLTQNNMPDFFLDYLLIDSGGYGSHAFRTLPTLISRSLHPITTSKIQSVTLGDQDGHGVSIPLVTLGGVLDPRRVQNQNVHLVENLQPIFAGDLRNKPNTDPLDRKDEMALDTVDKRLIMIQNNLPQVNLAPWIQWATTLRQNGQKISATNIPNLIGFLFHHPTMANLQRLHPGTSTLLLFHLLLQLGTGINAFTAYVMQ